MISRYDKSIQQYNYTRRALSSGMCCHVDQEKFIAVTEADISSIFRVKE
jgi:hypothetical protein